MNRAVKLSMALYLCGSVVAFGHSYNHDYTQQEYMDNNGIRAVFSAIFWPLYFSKVAFEGVRP